MVTIDDLYYLKSLFERVPHFILVPSLKNINEILQDMIKNLESAYSYIHSFHYPQNMQTAVVLQKRLNEYEKIITCLRQAAFQRLEGYSTTQSSFFFAIEDDFTSKRVYKAIDILVTHYLKCYFLKDGLENLITITFFGDNPTYNIDIYENLAIVQIPKVDATRCRFWACLGHESVHERFFHTNLCASHVALEKKVVQEITAIGEKTFKVVIPELAKKQFEEIICDLSALIISGLPDLMTLISFSAIPKLEADKIRKHPPLDTRFYYMYRYLSTLKSADYPEYNRSLEICKSSWDHIKNDLKTLFPMTDEEQTYICAYNKLIDSHFEDLLELAKSLILINSNEIFSAFSWYKGAEAYQQLITGVPLGDLKLSITELFNLTWIKRIGSFESVGVNNKSSEDFLVSHAFERKLFEEFVNKVIET